MTTPRIEYNLPAAEYRKAEGFSKTGTDSIDDCLALFRAEQTGKVQREETGAMAYGTLLHAIILEGRADYHIRPETYAEGKKWNGNSIDCKQWIADHSDKPILTKPESDELHHVAAAIMRHKHAAPLFVGAQTEVSMFGIHERTGLKIKSRPDILNRGLCVLGDLKSMADASSRAVSSAIFNWKYHVQAYWYRYIARQNGLDIGKFFFVAVERKTMLFNVRELSEEAIELGGIKMDSRLEKLKSAMESGEWPDYSGTTEKPGAIDLPTFAYTDTTGCELIDLEQTETKPTEGDLIP